MGNCRIAFLGLLACVFLPLCGGCGGSSSNKASDPGEPAFSVGLFTLDPSGVDNPFFPLEPGKSYNFRVENEDGDIEIIVVDVLETTRIVAGVECAIVRDRVFQGELLIEDTHDFYAQDDNGNVWYMGEEVVNYEYDDDDNLIGTDNEGAWEAGKDVAGVGSIAEPGIIMKATLVVGDSYQQEFYAGEAEDMGEIIALNVLVTLSNGLSYSCVKIRDTNPLEPMDPAEFKYFAAGIGLVLEEAVDGSEEGELLGVFFLGDGSLPDFGAATFTNPAVLTNPFFSFPPETARTFVAATEDGVETIVVELQDTTRLVNGIECAVVRDRVFLDELLIEDTHDWYAQDDSGNVWYMGEEVINYEYDDDENVIGTDSEGAWEAGVDGAEPGILMWATPIPGQAYRQEFYEDEAEDVAVVVATGVTVELENGQVFQNCLQTLEGSPLEPYAPEYKFSAPGLGVVLEQPLDDSEPVEFIGDFDTSENGLPDFDAATFTNPAQITNPFLPFTPGVTREYEKDTEDGLELVVSEVLATTVTVNGIECAVVREREFLDGLLMEDTHDWYAQDDDGNVWYMGEEVVNYEYDDDDNFLGTDDEGSWEAGVDDAEPGILMWASPSLGRSYRQEFYEDEAEDMGLDFAIGVEVELEDGTIFTNCLQVVDWTPLEPGALEYKYYAPGVGLIKEEDIGSEEEEPLELTSGP